MPEIRSTEAIDRARDALGLGDQINARAWRVRRLDRPEAYYLVIFGEQDASTAVAVVSATGELTETALLTGRGPHLAVDETRATLLAGSPAGVHPALVWKPSRASRSPLYPVWEIRTPSGTSYVDQEGHVWPALDAAGPGG